MRTKMILELYKRGMRHAEIAAVVGCTRANVSQTIKRQRSWLGRISALPDKEHNWLLTEAERQKVPPDHLARTILILAIKERSA